MGRRNQGRGRHGSQWNSYEWRCGGKFQAHTGKNNESHLLGVQATYYEIETKKCQAFTGVVIRTA